MGDDPRNSVVDGLQRHIDVFEIDRHAELGFKTGERQGCMLGSGGRAVAVELLPCADGVGLCALSPRRVFVNLSEDGFEALGRRALRDRERIDFHAVRRHRREIAGFWRRCHRHR
ncbi:MAG: hypothetical protein ACREYE_01610 [Gammaproteobacteria bacterium]